MATVKEERPEERCGQQLIWIFVCTKPEPLTMRGISAEVKDWSGEINVCNLPLSVLLCNWMLYVSL